MILCIFENKHFLTKCCEQVGDFAGQKDSDILLYFVHHIDFTIAFVGGGTTKNVTLLHIISSSHYSFYNVYWHGR